MLSSDEEIRLLSASVLGDIAEKQLDYSISDNLESDTEMLIWSQAEIDCLIPTVQLDNLIAMLQDADPDICVAAIKTLGAIGNRRVLRDLSRARRAARGSFSKFFRCLVRDSALEAGKQIRQRIANKTEIA